MLKVGLTGGIASGKSTVSAMFKNKGIKIIDADIIAREVLNIYPQLKDKIKTEFGEHFFDSKGELLRKELGDYVFKYVHERKKLEDILIPYIIQEIFKSFDEYDRNGEKVCILDAPTLIEQGLQDKMDINILVWVDKATQLSRLTKRDSLKEEQAESRIRAQMSLDEKKEYVNFIVDNSKGLEDTKKQVEEIMSFINVCLK